MNHNFLSIFRIFLLFLFTCSSTLFAAADDQSTKKNGSPLHEKPSEAPEKVEVRPKTSDQEISKRLENILKATNWFINPRVKLENGVAFLSGQTKNKEFKDWATDLARNTEGVVAVVNNISIQEPSIWDIDIILSELLNLWHKIVKTLPAIFTSFLILFIAWLAAKLIYKLMGRLFRNLQPALLYDVFARIICSFVFLIGVYFIFEMIEFTTVALTVISGTGLIGLILGIAFRDITENFLASILLSIQNPFHIGDLIDIVPPNSIYIMTGYVTRLTWRVSILMSLDGNHLQIPNSTVYKSNIRNYTTNPQRRDEFVINLPADTSVSQAEALILKTLNTQEEVLKKPESCVLIENLTQDVLTLRIYYWIDVRKHDWIKVKSYLMRLINEMIQMEHIGFSSRPIEKEALQKEMDTEQKATPLTSKDARLPEKGENLLKPNDK